MQKLIVSAGCLAIAATVLDLKTVPAGNLAPALNVTRNGVISAMLGLATTGFIFLRRNFRK